MLLLAARALHFWAVATLLGGAGFVLLLRPTSRAAFGLLRSTAVMGGLSGLAWFAAVFVDIGDGPSALLDRGAWQAFLTAPFGMPWAIRLVLCGMALGAAATRGVWPFLVLGLSLALDQAWLGHAAMASGTAAALQIAAYWVHVLAGFAWTGALVMISALSVEARRVPPHGLALFSAFGIVLVVALVLSGLVNAVLRGVTPATLLTTDYGRLLAFKLVLVTAMISLALINRRRARRAETKAPMTLWLETVLGLAVLVVAAALGTTPPPPP